MYSKNLVSSLLLGAALVGGSMGAAQAITVTISGSTPPFPGYGTATKQNNVINSPLAGNSVTDPGGNGATMLGSDASGPSMVTVSGFGVSGYNVDWYFIGAESGFVNTLIAPGINFSEADQNNQCVPCGGSLQSGPQLLGTSLGLGSSLIPFTLKDDHGASLANGPTNPIPGTNNVPSLVFSYVVPTGPSTWALSSGPTSGLNVWFLFGFNDKGGPDDNHDDFIGIARVYAANSNEPPVPIPGALVLFGSGLIGMAVLGRRRARRSGASA